MSKRIKFYYFRPCLKDQLDQNVDLTPYLKKIQSLPNAFIKEISTGNDTFASLNFIKLYANYKLWDSGRILSYPVWELRFPRSRVDVPEILNHSTRKLRSANLRKEERVAEQTVVLYDPACDIVVIENKQGAASVTHIRDVINFFVDDKKNYIDFMPMIDESALHRAKNQTSTHYINVRLINATDPFWIDANENKSVQGLIQAANAISPQNEYAVQAEITLKIERAKRKKGFVQQKFHYVLDGLLSLLGKKKIDKLNVNGFNKDGHAETINLITERISDKYDFDVSVEKRLIQPEAIFDKMVLKYDERRFKYLKSK